MGSQIETVDARRQSWQSPSARTHPAFHRNKESSKETPLTKLFKKLFVRMCIPTKVAPTTAGFLRANISKMTRTKTSTVPSQAHLHARQTRTFATLRCGPVNKGVKEALGNTPEMASCPVVTYCSILTIFTAIVYGNMAHGMKKIQN